MVGFLGGNAMYEGVYRYWGYKNGYLVKIGGFELKNMWWEGGSTKEFWEEFTNI